MRRTFLPASSFLASSFLASIVLAFAAQATTFVVPPDSEMVRRADLIVVASATNSWTVATADGGIETVTNFSVEEQLKGSSKSNLEIHELGGILGDRAEMMAGIPHFEEGQREIVFLTRTPRGTLAVTELALGRFSLATDENGKRLAIRNESDIVGWDLNGQPHKEQRRDAEKFLAYLRAVGHGASADADYFLTGARSRLMSEAAGGYQPHALMPVGNVAVGTGLSYTMGDGNGYRWTVFPTAVSVYNENTEAGAPNGGVTAIQTGLAAWTNDSGSNVNYVYAGADSTHTTGLAGPDGRNTVIFDRNLTSYGAGAFQCGSGGTLGIGGITSASGTNVLNGQTYYSIKEIDVEMNQGLANCSYTSSPNFASALTHELGHTLGFRHSNQTRADNPSIPCSTDATLECSSAAIMNSSIVSGLNSVLQTWDQHAVRLVYPGSQTPPTCTAVAITTQPASKSITSGASTTLTVAVSGTAPFTYQWYNGTSPSTASPISGATGASLTVAPTSTKSYWVQVKNSCGTANSSTATITVTQTVPPSSKRIIDFDHSGKGDLFWRNTTTGQNVAWLMNGATISSFSASPTVADLNWNPVVFGDFDANGTSDSYWYNRSTGQSQIWLMSGGSATITTSVTISDLNWRPVGGGDFNGDGHGDVVWFNPSTGGTRIYFLSGTTYTTASASVSMPSPWSPVGFGDFNGDGKTDLFWYNSSTGASTIWLMNGATIVSSAGLMAVSDLTWKPIAAGDFNGDGKADIFWRNAAASRNSIWFQDGLTTTTRSPVTAMTSDWTPVAFNNFDGNATTDIFWFRAASGGTNLWLMNGATVTTATSIGTVSGWRPVAMQ